MQSDENAEISKFEIDFLARAIAASFHLKPQQWLARYGGFGYAGWIPAAHRHLRADYKEVLTDMRSKVHPILGNSIKPDYTLNIGHHFT